MRKLISAKHIEALILQGEKVFQIDGNEIITPSAQDLARINGIIFTPMINVETKVQDKEEAKVETKIQVKEEAKAETEIESKVETKIEAKAETKMEAKTETEIEPKIEIEIQPKVETEIEAKVQVENEVNVEAKIEAKVETKIEVNVEAKVETKVQDKSDINIEEMDSEMLLKLFREMNQRGLLEQIIECLKGKSLPFEAESDASGFKVVRGSTVKMEAFDTGNPNAKVYYQELVGEKESEMRAGFLIIENSKFDWELTYEEINYVIEGTLTIEINGKTYTAHSGDVLFVPAGSKVVWGSPDKARVFYATYPMECV